MKFPVQLNLWTFLFTNKSTKHAVYCNFEQSLHTKKFSYLTTYKIEFLSIKFITAIFLRCANISEDFEFRDI
jgi:hypothetical protein